MLVQTIQIFTETVVNPGICNIVKINKHNSLGPEHFRVTVQVAHSEPHPAGLQKNGVEL